jgi:hypothetical protein
LTPCKNKLAIRRLILVSVKMFCPREALTHQRTGSRTNGVRSGIQTRAQRTKWVRSRTNGVRSRTNGVRSGIQTRERTGSGLAFRHELNARSGSGLVEQGDVAWRVHGNSTNQVPERFRIIETFRILAQIFYSGLCRVLGTALH